MNIAKIMEHLPALARRHKLVELFLRMSPDSAIQKVTFNDGATLFADISDAFPRAYFLMRSFEPEFFRIAHPFLAKGGHFFDVGANFGFCSFGMMAEAAGRIEYHLFEANVDIVKILKRSMTLHPKEKISLNHCCVSDQPGVSKLKVDSKQLGSSYISDKGDQDVTNLVLDHYIRQRGIKRIDFMKMDVEGWEPLALRGGINSFIGGVVPALYMELSTINLARNKFTPWDCLDFLKAAGFSLFYCKQADFIAGVADDKKAFTLHVNGRGIRVAPLENLPEQYQTDVLAIHESAGWLQKK